MLSETLKSGLNRYGIGAKVRALRLRKKLGLVELGKHTGLSPALLSKIERGRVVTTLPTLMRISLVFGVGMEHFFSEDQRLREVGLVRAAERLAFPAQQGERKPAYHFESLDFPAQARKMEAFLAHFHPVPEEKVKRHEHHGGEFIFILKGKLGIRIGEEDYELEMNDSIYFNSGIPHGYRRLGKFSCEAIVVTVP
jgi:transcriptional regulator with XRE-family HTH domain